MPERTSVDKSSLKVARTPPIDLVPVEIFTRIFGLVCTMYPCPVSGTEVTPHKPTLFMKDPVVLSHVCSYWRRIAISTQDLWTHIDLVPNLFPDRQLPKGAGTYLARSGEKLLDVHISSPYFNGMTLRPSTSAQRNLVAFLSTIAPRTWSVTVEIVGTTIGKELCRWTMYTLLKNCSPGTLTRFSTKVMTNNTPFLGQMTLMELPQTAVEALWLPVNVLHLHDFYPRWASTVYHGLTELRLSGGPKVSIPESALIDIFYASPKLRVLQLQMGITGTTPDNFPITPVFLEDLEVLILGRATKPDFAALLRLIHPGPKPLSLSIVGPWLRKSGTDFTTIEAKKFFIRSNVTRLVATQFSGYSHLASMLAMAPTVRVLALDRCTCTHPEPNNGTLPLPSLDALCVTGSSKTCAFTWPCIEQLIKHYRVSKLILWSYDFRYTALGRWGIKTVPHNLHTVCPWVTVLSNRDPDPTQRWR